MKVLTYKNEHAIIRNISHYCWSWLYIHICIFCKIPLRINILLYFFKILKYSIQIQLSYNLHSICVLHACHTYLLHNERNWNKKVFHKIRQFFIWLMLELILLINTVYISINQTELLIMLFKSFCLLYWNLYHFSDFMKH